jgi:sterol desaturase/sphingolipid hydroxylase (fatty acid hydroxylase superfamily)
MVLAITFAALAVALLLELARPRRRLEFPTVRRRIGNLGIWLGSLVAAAMILLPRPPLFAWPLESPVPSFIVAFLALDLLSYALHRAQHAVPVLWWLHAVHHSDPDVDCTTSVRRHPIEFLWASGVFWLAVVLGIPVNVAVTHGAALFLLAAFSHANLRWPVWIERALRPVVVTASLHLVHHSVDECDLNRNFGAVLSVWDRLFGTFAPARPISAFGVAALDRANACRPLAMLATPWALSRHERLPKEFHDDAQIQAVSFDPDEEIWQHRLTITRGQS